MLKKSPITIVYIMIKCREAIKESKFSNSLRYNQGKFSDLFANSENNSQGLLIDIFHKKIF